MSWLLDEIGFKQLTDPEKIHLTDLAAETIYNRVVLRVADQTGDEQISAIRQLLDNESEEAVKQFFQSHQLNFDQLVDEEIENYQEEMIRAKKLLTEEADE